MAVDPGTRFMGVAVLCGDALLYHGVATLTATGAPQRRVTEVRRVVLDLIREFRPSQLAIESAFFARNRTAALLNILVDEIKSVALKQGIAVHGLPPTTVKKRLCGDGTATKRQVALVVVSYFPELGAYFDRGSARTRRYHGNMFDAVGVGMVVQDDLTHRPRRR